MPISRHLPVLILWLFWSPNIYATDLSGDYFPQGRTNQFGMSEWFAQYLSETNEPSLYKFSKENVSANAYRFIYFPPFDAVTILRLEIKPDGSALLELRKMEQVEVQTSYQPGRLVRKAAFLVSKRGVNHFLALLQQMNFWHLQPDDRSRPACLDAEAWLYEAAAFGKYHVVERDYPTYPEVTPPGEYLMTLTGEGR